MVYEKKYMYAFIFAILVLNVSIFPMKEIEKITKIKNHGIKIIKNISNAILPKSIEVFYYPNYKPNTDTMSKNFGDRNIFLNDNTLAFIENNANVSSTKNISILNLQNGDITKRIQTKISEISIIVAWKEKFIISENEGKNLFGDCFRIWDIKKASGSECIKMWIKTWREKGRIGGLKSIAENKFFYYRYHSSLSLGFSNYSIQFLNLENIKKPLITKCKKQFCILGGIMGMKYQKNDSVLLWGTDGIYLSDNPKERISLSGAFDQIIALEKISENKYIAGIGSNLLKDVQNVHGLDVCPVNNGIGIYDICFGSGTRILDPKLFSKKIKGIFNFINMPKFDNIACISRYKVTFVDRQTLDQRYEIDCSDFLSTKNDSICQAFYISGTIFLITQKKYFITCKFNEPTKYSQQFSQNLKKSLENNSNNKKSKDIYFKFNNK